MQQIESVLQRLVGVSLVVEAELVIEVKELEKLLTDGPRIKQLLVLIRLHALEERL